MEDLLFSCYMNKMKELNGGIWFRFKRLPVLLKISLVFMLIDIVFLVVTAIWFEKFIWIPCFIEIAIAFLTFFSGDFYQIKDSKAKFKDHIEICNELKDYYDELGITSTEYLADIKSRMVNKLKIIDENCEKNKQILSQLTQALVVPAILALFGAVISGKENAQFALTVGLVLFIVILFFIFLIFVVVFANNLANRICAADYQRFINSLQTIIDIDNSYIALREENIQ